MKSHSRERREPTPVRAINDPPVLGPVHRKALMALALNGPYHGQITPPHTYHPHIDGLKIGYRIMSGLVRMGYGELNFVPMIGWKATITPAGRDAIGVE